MELFDNIIRDNQSGSGTILRHVQEEILVWGTVKKTVEKKGLQDTFGRLTEQFPQFGLLWHFIRAFNEHFTFKEKITGAELRQFVEAYSGKWQDAQDKACRHMLDRVDFTSKNVLVHSNSSAIRRLFQILSERNTFPVVWQTYSSPAGEGLVQAEFISGMGFETHLIHEDALSNFIHRLDMAVFGADMIMEERFLNKAGTFPIAMLFRYFDKPVYVLAEQRKKISQIDLPEIPSEEKEKPAVELLPEQVKNVSVHNLYFEFTPLSLVNRVFLDD